MNRLPIAPLSLLVLHLCVQSAWSISSTVISFENLPGDLSLILNGYYGLNWNSFGMTDGSEPLYDNSGYDNGRVSGVNVAFNDGGDLASTLTVSGDPFTFVGAYFTAAWNNGLSITIGGYNNGVLQNTTTFSADTDAPTLVALNYANIDELRFQSFGGVHGGAEGFGTHFVMDDFTYSPIPEPATLILCVSGLGLSWGRKRQVQLRSLANKNRMTSSKG